MEERAGRRLRIAADPPLRPTRP
jgi:predicted transposase YbfD/YdcC